MLLLRFAGSFLLRFDVRRFLGLLFHEPPRRTLLSASPYADKSFLGFIFCIHAPNNLPISETCLAACSY